MKIILLFFILILSLTSICFAQSNQTESLTITTYYPAPYGVYRDLIARKSFAVGDFTSSEVQNLNPGQLQVKESIAVGNIAASDVKNLKQGDLYINGSLRIAPRTGPSSGWATGKEGEVAYYSGELYVSNGVSWAKVTGGTATTNTTQTLKTIICADSDAACLKRCVNIISYFWPVQTITPAVVCGVNGIYYNCCHTCTSTAVWSPVSGPAGQMWCESGKKPDYYDAGCVPTYHTQTQCQAY